MTVRIHWRNRKYSATHRIVRLAAALFAAIGLVLLSVCAKWSLEAYLIQNVERARFYGSFINAPSPDRRLDIQPKPSSQGRGEPLSLMEIPRLGVSVAVVEGVTSRDLRIGAGHIPGTALPGQGGNVAIAAHRDTFFRKLRSIRKGDAIVLKTLSATYRYSVESTAVVKPTDVKEIQNSAASTLTLVTCYPFYFVGSAPQRFIVRARQVEAF
jgi:sortase A